MTSAWGMLVPGDRPELVRILLQELFPSEDPLVAPAEES